MGKLGKRFKKPEGKPPSIRLTKRDRNIIHWVWKLRFASSEHLRVLLGIRKGSGYRSLQRRLRKLWITSYLVRPPEQLVTKLKYPNCTHLVYGIGTKASRELGKDGVDLGKVSWTRKNKLVRSPFIAHQLALTDFHVAVHLAVSERPDLGLRWYKEGRINDGFSYQGKKYRVKPDAWMILERNLEGMYFLIEADMATVSNRRILRRFRAYTYWWREDRHQHRYGMGSNIRVLFLCVTKRRREALKRLAQTADGRGKGLKLFWFCSQQDYDYHRPESVFEQIFIPAGDDAMQSILKKDLSGPGK